MACVSGWGPPGSEEGPGGGERGWWGPFRGNILRHFLIQVDATSLQWPRPRLVRKAMAYNGHVQIQMAVAGDENGLELESEQDVLRMICEHSDFAMVCLSAPCAHIMSVCANVLSQSKPALAQHRSNRPSYGRLEAARQGSTPLFPPCTSGTSRRIRWVRTGLSTTQWPDCQMPSRRL